MTLMGRQYIGLPLPPLLRLAPKSLGVVRLNGTLSRAWGSKATEGATLAANTVTVEKCCREQKGVKQCGVRGMTEQQKWVPQQLCWTRSTGCQGENEEKKRERTARFLRD